jgi:hypothetical protein
VRYLSRGTLLIVSVSFCWFPFGCFVDFFRQVLFFVLFPFLSQRPFGLRSAALTEGAVAVRAHLPWACVAGAQTTASKSFWPGPGES